MLAEYHPPLSEWCCPRLRQDLVISSPLSLSGPTLKLQYESKALVYSGGKCTLTTRWHQDIVVGSAGLMSEWPRLKHHTDVVKGFDYNSSLDSDSIESGLITVWGFGLEVSERPQRDDFAGLRASPLRILCSFAEFLVGHPRAEEMCVPWSCALAQFSGEGFL